MALGERFDRDQHRRPVGDPEAAVAALGQPPQGAQAVLVARLRDVLAEALAIRRADPMLKAVVDLVDVEARVPDVDVAHLREAAHRRAIAARRCEHGRPSLRLVEAAVATRDLEAGGEPLDVPLERTRQRLVEVVDVEHQTAVRRGKASEVGEMRVSAQLRAKVRARRRRQVGGHDRRGPAVERERASRASGRIGPGPDRRPGSRPVRQGCRRGSDGPGSAPTRRARHAGPAVAQPYRAPPGRPATIHSRRCSSSGRYTRARAPSSPERGDGRRQPAPAARGRRPALA